MRVTPSGPSRRSHVTYEQVQAGRQADGQTDRQTDAHAHTHTYNIVMYVKMHVCFNEYIYS